MKFNRCFLLKLRCVVVESLFRRTPFTSPLAGEAKAAFGGFRFEARKNAEAKASAMSHCRWVPGEGAALSKDLNPSPTLSRKGRGSAPSSRS